MLPIGFFRPIISHFSQTPLLLNGMKHIDARKKVLKLYELINTDIEFWLEEWKLKYALLEQESGSKGSDADAKINASKLELEKVTIIYVCLMFFEGS